MATEVDEALNFALREFCKQSHRTMNFWVETIDEVGGRICKMWHTSNLCFGGEPKWKAYAEVHELRGKYRWRIKTGADRTWTKGYAFSAEEARAEAGDALHARGYISPYHMKGRAQSNGTLLRWIS